MGDRVRLDGLLQGSASLFSTSEYNEKWRIAELKTADLLVGIQPCRPSEDCRRAVINYVEGLIERNFDDCIKVFPYGSVPLKTYLPNGDIDLTAIINCHGSTHATWAKEMCAVLEKEEHTHNADFQVKEVICIHAQVPVVKCLVENIVVDISFNQLGGLSALCFLEEVDKLIGQNHLFKRSIILVKAWCFYESRILGAHRGLLSTYALETLVLFVFNVFHRSLRGPLEVLFRFLEFFSKFDWNRYCLGIWGPIPLLSLHKMAVESLQDVSGQFLLSEGFLDACREKYCVCFEGTQGNTFSQKFMNMVDPLRRDNNLGRSVNRGSFIRIQSALAYGAEQLEKMIHSSSHINLAERVAKFFRNTHEHCRGRRPDAFSGFEFCQQVNASLCDDEARSESANTEAAVEEVVEHAQLSPSCNGAQVQRDFVVDNDKLYFQLNGISKCIKNANICNFPKIFDLTASINDDTNEVGGTSLFGEDPCYCSFQDLKTSCKRLERRNSATSSSQRKLCRFLADSTIGVAGSLYITMHCLASAKGIANCENSLYGHAFYNILKRKIQSETLRSSTFGATLSLVPWLSAKIEIHQEGNVHVGMQPEKHSSHPIIYFKSRYLFPSGSQASLLEEDHDLHHQFTALTNQTEVDILRGDLPTYLLNLEVGRCTRKSCLQQPLVHASRTKNYSLPVEQGIALEGPGSPKAIASPISLPHAMPMSDLLAEGSPKSCSPNLEPLLHRSETKNYSLPVKQGSALEGPERPKAVAPPIPAPHAMPTRDLLAEGSRRSCKGTGAFFPNLVPGFDPKKRWRNGTRGRGRVNTSKTSSKVKLKAREKEKALLMEGPVHGAGSSYKTNLRARNHVPCQQSSQGPYQVNEEDFPPLTARDATNTQKIVGHTISMNQSFYYVGREFEIDEL